MRRLAAVVHLLLLQFLLLGAGDACVLSAVTGAVAGVRPTAARVASADVFRVADAGASTADMPGMQGVPCADARGAASRAPTSRAPTSRAPTHRSAPHAPTGCTSLAPCAPAALPAATSPAVASVPARLATDVPASVVRRLASRVPAPEPPPPRA